MAIEGPQKKRIPKNESGGTHVERYGLDKYRHTDKVCNRLLNQCGKTQNFDKAYIMDYSLLLGSIHTIQMLINDNE